MTSAEFKHKLLQEIELIPEDELDKLYDVIHAFRLSLKNRPDNKENKVLDFVDFLQEKSHEIENKEWNQFSLEQAMRGLENDNLPEYTEADLVEKWQ